VSSGKQQTGNDSKLAKTTTVWAKEQLADAKKVDEKGYKTKDEVKSQSQRLELGVSVQVAHGGPQFWLTI